MKKLLSLLLVCLMLVLCAGPALAGCAYKDQHGDHNWDMIDFTYGSCTTDGGYVLECKNCGITKTEVSMPATGHKWKVLSKQDPTCVDSGYRVCECEYCGEQMTEKLKAKGHSFVDDALVEAATCTKPGIMNTHCSVCGYPGKREVYADHSYGAWEITMNPTDHTMGVKTRTCKGCGDTKTDTFYPDGTLYRGGKNDVACTKELQKALKEKGYLKDKVDGTFGRNTEAAVKAYQKAQGFTVDGIAWPQTLNSLWGYIPEIIEPEQPTEPETPVKVEYPPYCQTTYNEKGEETLAMCEKHAQLRGLTTDGLANLTNPAARTLALSQYRTFWADEANTLYEEWFAAVPEAEKPMVSQSRAMFLMQQNDRENTWARLFADTPDIAMQKSIDAYIDQCVELCGILSFYPQEIGE